MRPAATVSLAVLALLAGHASAATDTEVDGERFPVVPLTMGPSSAAPFVGAAATRRLEAAVARYEATVADGGWPAIPPGREIEPGAADPRATPLRQRLAAGGDLASEAAVGDTFDTAVAAALRRFQYRHGLLATGALDAPTLAALNVPASARLAQLRLNLDRSRASEPAGRRVVVNIPAAKLQAVAGDRVELYSLVVVGAPKTPTPELRAEIAALNFHPHWHIPRSVVANGVLPMLAKDPNYLRKRSIRVYRNWREVDPARIDWRRARLGSYVFRQDPGPFNALRAVRLDMENRHNVYLHDTPDQMLFYFPDRAQSAGCVRVREAVELAAWLLAGRDDWPRVRLDEAVAAERQVSVTLADPVPVDLVYLTAWVAADGAVHFRRDLYGWDATSPGG